jgi:anhydro-N-acetylmuramic acid kinase
VEREITLAHAEAVKQLMQEQGLKPEDIGLIGFHGQTIAHDPGSKWTCQLGDGALLAKTSGIRVVNDFRTADVAAGGQGAPLAPVYHKALAAGREQPLAFLNIGGVANVTYVGENEIIAFDTGPGNALIDDWMLKKTRRKFDDDGAYAASGVVNDDVLEKLMAHEYFTAEPPKSLDRNAFSLDLCEHLSVEDGAATLSAFTVAGIMRAHRFLPARPREWIVSGGGRLNGTLMAALADWLEASVIPIEDIGFNGDAIEAEAFAYMAVRSLCGLPISFPKTTGVPAPMTGGKLNPVPVAA